MKDLLIGAAKEIRGSLRAAGPAQLSRRVLGVSPGGDAQFDIDEVAEAAVWKYLMAHAPVPLAVQTEDNHRRDTGDDPRHLLVIDPIDGTRPASAGLEMAMISIAVAPLDKPDPTIGDVTHALLMELKSGAWMYAGPETDGVEAEGFAAPVPALSTTADPRRMFWSLEFNGHPMALMSDAYAHLVDASANTGGVFVFNSASYSISRILTGQLDAYVDIGNRVLRDRPETEADFRRVGGGKVLHLFPYDIAAAVVLARRAGVVITDAYGAGLEETDLLDLSPLNQRSCVAASTPELHARLLDTIRW
ncbi:inositol monophosphatase family protein [Streptomyces sp. NPDC088810]|uniref:inositol monophosphatase family protein n=1 Tax=Streptomyces sp. NPDC088810 TaxID=3365904 RepID=UPI0037FE6033